MAGFITWILLKADEYERKRQRKAYYENITMYNSLIGKNDYSIDTDLKDAAKAELEFYINDSHEKLCKWRKEVLILGDADKIAESNKLLLKRDTIIAKLKNDEEIPEDVYAESYFDVDAKKVY